MPYNTWKSTCCYNVVNVVCANLLAEPLQHAHLCRVEIKRTLEWILILKSNKCAYKTKLSPEAIQGKEFTESEGRLIYQVHDNDERKIFIWFNLGQKTTFTQVADSIVCLSFGDAFILMLNIKEDNKEKNTNMKQRIICNYLSACTLHSWTSVCTIICVFVLLSVICMRRLNLTLYEKQPYKAYKGRTW